MVQTIEGIVSLTKELLSSNSWTYVLTGMFQTDELESEFGQYRQLCGGCYHISLDQVRVPVGSWILDTYCKLQCIGTQHCAFPKVTIVVWAESPPGYLPPC